MYAYLQFHRRSYLRESLCAGHILNVGKYVYNYADIHLLKHMHIQWYRGYCMTCNLQTMALPTGRYRLLHKRPEDSKYWPDSGGQKLGDARVTTSCELRRPPEEVIYIWTGGIVYLDPPYSYAVILPTGEARMFIRTLGGDGAWYCGWVTYHPFPLARPGSMPWWAFEGVSESCSTDFNRFHWWVQTA